MKVTVLNPPQIDPKSTTPPPGRALRVDGDAQGLAIDSDARRPWSAVRFFMLDQLDGTPAPTLLVLVDGRRRPFDFSTATFSGSAFAETDGDPRRVAMALIRQAPRVVLDRTTVEILKGTASPRSDDPRAYLAAVQRTLAIGEARTSEPETDTGEAMDGAPAPNAERVTEPVALPPCPHCDHPRAVGSEKCDRCGAVFAKIERQIDPNRTQAALDTDADQGQLDDPLGFDAEFDAGAGAAPTSRWGPSFLSADSVAAAVIGVLRTDGWRLALTAAACIATWLVVMGGLLLFADGPLRFLLAGIGIVIAYGHTLLSLSHAIHAQANDEPWKPVSAWTFGLKCLPTALPSRILGAVMILLGLAAMVVPGFVFAMRTAFVEPLVVIERRTPQGIGWGQVATNLSDGVRFAVGGHLLIAAAVSLAVIVVPSVATSILAILELVHPSTWTLPSVGLVTVTLFALAATAYAATIWATALYVLCRELQDVQGPAVWNAPSGLSGWVRLTLLVDVFMLLFFLVRASKLDS